MIGRKPKFSGHQTFVFRFGWLEKGYKFSMENRNFNDESAIIDLGVGKNMVGSIKYWCELTGIIKDNKITEFGNLLLDEQTGWDPYLEDNASLWLLHWKLMTSPDYWHSGSVLFSHLHKPEFSKSDVFEAIDRVFDSESTKRNSQNIILRDIDCYIRLYAGLRHNDSKNKEDAFGSPFQELNMIQVMRDSELFRFNIGPKTTLPSEVIGYAIWEYMQNTGKVSIRINEALYHEYSPGQVFMLDENSLIEAVENLSSYSLWTPYFRFTESSGIALIYCSLPDGNDLLQAYYKRGHSS
jgi:hypothetical protein